MRVTSVLLFVKSLATFKSRYYDVKIVCRYMSNSSGMCRVLPFNFMNYDGIGFDLDHTICQYNLENIIKLQYKLLVDYLIDKGYPSDIFSKELTSANVDFIQRGLFLDFKRGNILYTSEDGTILRACHGTKLLKDYEIIDIYGIDKKWEPTTMFAEDILSVWEPPWSDVMRSMMDFTDAQVPLVFAQVIDYVDRCQPGTTSYSVWPVILDGIVDMFKPGGSYYVNLYSHPHLYLRKCKLKVLEWMLNLKKNDRCLFLLTGAREEEAKFLADFSLGNDWKCLFDFIVYDAKKPGFFTKRRPFLENNFNGRMELSQPVELTQGNWQALRSLIAAKKSVLEPKCVYIGDNLLQDVYITSLTSNLDSIAMVEELSEENFLLGKFDKHPNSDYVKSKIWHSYIFAPNASYTVWGSIIRKHSKLSIPSLEYVAKKTLDHSFIPFWLEISKL